MHQAPAQPLDQRPGQRCSPRQSRVTPLSLAFEILDQLPYLGQIFDLTPFWVAIACMTSSSAEPPNARRTRSPTSLPLGLLLAPAGPVDVRPLRFIAHHQPLLGHDLQELEHRRVTRRLRSFENIPHLAHRRRPLLPEHAAESPARHRSVAEGRSSPCRSPSSNQILRLRLLFTNSFVEVNEDLRNSGEYCIVHRLDETLSPSVFPSCYDVCGVTRDVQGTHSLGGASGLLIVRLDTHRTEERNSMASDGSKADPGVVLDLLESFRRSKTMFAAVSLGIFDTLEAGPESLSAWLRI